MKNKKTRKNREAVDSSVGRFAKSIAVGTVSSIILMMALTFIFSAVALAFTDPNSTILGFSLAALLISSFLGGFIALKMNSSSALLCGLITGALLLLSYLFLSFIFNSHESSSSVVSVLIYRISIPIFSLIGAYSGFAKPKKRPHRK